MDIDKESWKALGLAPSDADLVEITKLQKVMKNLVGKVMTMDSNIENLFGEMANRVKPSDLDQYKAENRVYIGDKLGELAKESAANLKAAQDVIDKQAEEINRLNGIIDELNENLKKQQEEMGTLAKKDDIDRLDGSLKDCAKVNDLNSLKGHLDSQANEMKNQMNRQAESLKREMKDTSQDFSKDIARIRDELEDALSKCALKSDFDNQTDFLSHHLDELDKTVKSNIDKNQTKFDTVDKVTSAILKTLDDKASNEALNIEIYKLRDQVSQMVAQQSADSKTSLANILAAQAMIEQTIGEMKNNHQQLSNVVDTKASTENLNQLTDRVDKCVLQSDYLKEIQNLQDSISRQEENVNSVMRRLSKKADLSMMNQVEQRVTELEREIKLKVDFDSFHMRLKRKADVDALESIQDVLEALKRELTYLSKSLDDVKETLEGQDDEAKKERQRQMEELRKAILERPTIVETKGSENKNQSKDEDINSIPAGAKVVYRCLMCDRVSPVMASCGADEGTIASQNFLPQDSPTPNRFYKTSIEKRKMEKAERDKKLVESRLGKSHGTWSARDLKSAQSVTSFPPIHDKNYNEPPAVPHPDYYTPDQSIPYSAKSGNNTQRSENNDVSSPAPLVPPQSDPYRLKFAN